MTTTAHAAGPLTEPARTVLLATAGCAVAAAVLGTVIVPGLRGNAPEDTVVLAERVSNVLSYGACALLVLSIAGVALGLARRGWPVWPVRTTMVTGALLVAAAAVMSALSERLDTRLTIVLSIAGEGAVLLASALALRRPETRAIGAVLVALALASAARLSSWALASQATEQASVSLYALARAAATVGVIFEATAQIIAVAWLGRRAVGREGTLVARIGTIAAGVAIAIALLASWAAIRGGQEDATLLDVVLHTAFDHPTTPPAYFVGAGLVIFLGATALALAGASFVTTLSVGAPAACLALALVSGGAFDVPLRCLAAVGAACFLVLSAASRPLPPGFAKPPAPAPPLTGRASQ